VLQSKVKLDLVALLEVINRIVTVLTIVFFVLLHWGLYAIILSVLIGNVVSTILNICLAPDFYRFASVPSFDLIKKVVKSSFPVGVTSLLALLYFKVDTLMLSVMKSPVDVGIYSLSYKLFENIIMLWAFYMASVYPLMAGYIHKDDQKSLRMIVRTSVIILVAFAVVTLSVGFIAAPLAIDILGGKSFVESILPFRILLFALPLVFLNNIFYFLLLSFSRVKWILLILLISLGFNFIVNVFVIPQFSYLGTSVSTVLTEAVTTIGYIFVLWKLLKLNPAKAF
jgi:O-antigen/teichoic acid export membrane protein